MKKMHFDKVKQLTRLILNNDNDKPCYILTVFRYLPKKKNNKLIWIFSLNFWASLLLTLSDTF